MKSGQTVKVENMVCLSKVDDLTRLKCYRFENEQSIFFFKVYQREDILRMCFQPSGYHLFYQPTSSAKVMTNA